MAPRVSHPSRATMPAAVSPPADLSPSMDVAVTATTGKFVSSSSSSSECMGDTSTSVSQLCCFPDSPLYRETSKTFFSAATDHSPSSSLAATRGSAIVGVCTVATAVTDAYDGVLGGAAHFEAWLKELLRPPRWRLLLDADPTIARPFPPQVCCCICVLQRRLEAAGRSFLEKYEVPDAALDDDDKNQRDKQRRRGTANKEEDLSEKGELYDEERWRSKRRGAGARGTAGNAAGRGGGGGSGSMFLSVTHLKKLLAADQTLYEVLGVREGASTDEIKKRYRKLVLEHHPDKAKRRHDGSFSGPSLSNDHLSTAVGGASPSASGGYTGAATAGGPSAAVATGGVNATGGGCGGASTGGSGASTRNFEDTAGVSAAPDTAVGGGASPTRKTSFTCGSTAAATTEKQRELVEGSEGATSSGGVCNSSCSNSAESEDEGHARFLKIQEAYEALTDVEFRRQYDSALPFDDSIPAAGSVKSPESFYTTFGPVFESNARWSARRPVPSLGDADTPAASVNSFYDFWFDFQSWRDFGIHDEYDLNEAESREERRWMDRENQRVRKKHMKIERARIQKLVETAHSLDPRVLKEKEAARKKREEEKAARQRALEEQRKQKELEERKLRESAAAEERRKEEEEKQRVLRERQQRDNHKKWRQRVRQLHTHFSKTTSSSSSSPPSPSSSAAGTSRVCLDGLQLQELCQKLSIQQLQDVCKAIFAAAGLEIPVADEEGAPVTLPELPFSEDMRDSVTDILMRYFIQTREAEKAQEKEAALEAERRQLERKAQEEAKRLARQGSWTPDELSLLAKGLQKYPGGTARRWKLIADLVGTKTQEEVVEKTKEMSEGMSLKSMGAKISQVAFNQFKIHNQGAFKKIEANPDKKDIADVPVPGRATQKSPQPDEKGSDEWTSAQQLALEKALAEFPSTMPASERWSSIGQRVPGKTRKECIERYKQIRAAILQAKKGESSWLLR